MFFSTLFVSLLLSLADASPLATRQTVDCSPSSATGLKPECWASLKMDEYIQDWVKTNGAAAKCDELGFAQCYLQFSGLNTLTCDLITSDTCPPPDSTETYSSDQHFYTLWNIYAVYQFFNQYSAALSNGVGLASTTVAKIVATVAPPIESIAKENEILSVLSSTFGVISVFAGIVPAGGGVAAGFIGAGLLRAVLLSKAIPDALLKQTAQARAVQLGDVSNSLGKLVATYQSNLLDAVSIIQRNETVFRTACSEGGFSQRVTTSLTIQSQELYKDLQFFVLSSALKANGIVSAKSAGVSALDFAKETDQISCGSLNEFGTCNQWYVDSEGNTYSFHNPNDPQNTQIGLMVALIDEAWAPLDKVFKNEACAGKATEFNPETLRADCVATYGSCEWNYQPDLPTSKREKQFKNCDNDPSWGTPCSSFEERILVSESYMGPLLKNDRNGIAQMCKRR